MSDSQEILNLAVMFQIFKTIASINFLWNWKCDLFKWSAMLCYLLQERRDSNFPKNVDSNRTIFFYVFKIRKQFSTENPTEDAGALASVKEALHHLPTADEGDEQALLFAFP